MLRFTHLKKQYFIKLIAASMVIMALMTSCAASGGSKSSEDYIGNYTEDYTVARNDDSFDEESAELAENTQAASDSKSGDNTSADYEDKIIRTADLTIESTDAQKCYDTLAAFAKQNGGREISVSKSSDTYGNYDYININAELKISPDKLSDFLELAEKTDKVTSSEVSTNDVTQEYYDIKLRLETKKEALNQYYKLLKEAKNIEETLEVQRYITDLIAEIESMEGMLRYYDAKVDLSTIHLSITQQDKLHVGAEDDFEWDSLSFSDFLTLVKNGFLSVVNFLWSLLLWLIIIIIAVSPILLIAGIVFFIIRSYRKKHPKKLKVNKQNKQNTAPNYMPVYYPPMQGNMQPNAPAQNPSPAQQAAPAAPAAPQEREKSDK